MQDKKEMTISILTQHPDKGHKAMFPTHSRLVNKYSDVGYHKLKEHFSDFVVRLQDIMETIPSPQGAFEVDSLTFAASIDAGGKISLIGELSAALGSSITITIRKKKATK